MRSRLLLTLTTTMFATAALALPPFVMSFEKTYKVKKGSAIEKADCAVCHVGMTPALNSYGKDLKKFIGADKKLSVAEMQKADKLDSDKDKMINLAEIRAGTLPGDPKSKPGKK